MNKKFDELFTSYGLKIDGNYAYGNLKGYETNILVNTLSAPPVIMHISFFATDEQKTKIMEEFANIKSKYLRYDFTGYGVTIGITGFTINKILSTLPDTINGIIDILKNNEATGFGFCPICGKEMDVEKSKTANIDNFLITLDEDCFDKINTEIQEANKNFKNAPNNYLKGFGGACIGGLAGFAVSFILYLCGFISAISAFVAIAVGTKLYLKFGGKQNKMMVVIVACTSLVFMILSIFTVYIMSAGAAASETGLAINAFEAFKICMNDKDFSTMFYTDFALTIVFSLISIIWEAVILTKRIKRPTGLNEK